MASWSKPNEEWLPRPERRKLAERLRDQGLGRWLELSLTSFADRLPARDRSRVLELGLQAGLRSVGELLIFAWPPLDRTSLRALDALVDLLWIALLLDRVGGSLDGDPQPAITAFARAQGVEGLLSLTVEKFFWRGHAPYVPGLSRFVRVDQLLFAQLPPNQRSAEAIGARRRTLALLLDTARERSQLLAAERERLARYAATPLSPALAIFAAKALQLRARLRSTTELSALRAQPIELRSDPVTLRIGGAQFGPAGRVSFLLEAPGSELVRHCECGRDGWGETACTHIFPALELLLEELYRPEGPWALRIAEAVATPGWERALRELSWVSQEQPPSGDPRGRLSFRVPEGKVALEVRLQRPAARGGWSAGRVVKASDAAQGLEGQLSTGERRALRLLSDLFQDRESVWHALEALIGHPRIFLGEGATPLRISRGTVDIEVAETKGGELSLSLSIEGAAVEGLAAGLKEGDLVAMADPPRAMVWLVQSSPELAAAARLIERGVAFPAEAHQSLLGKLAPLERALQIHLPPRLAGEPRPPDTRLRLQMEPRSSEAGPALAIEVQVEPLEGGLRYPPGQGPARLARLVAGLRFTTERDLTSEIPAARAVLGELGLTPDREIAPWRYLLSGEPLFELLDQLEPLLGERVVAEWPEARWRVTPSRAAGKLRVEIEDRLDWFGVSGGLVADGEKVSLLALLEAVRKKQRYVQLSKARWLQLSDTLRDELAPLSRVAQTQRGQLSLGPAAVVALEDFSHGLDEALVCERWRSLTARLPAARAKQPRLPASIKAELRPYQLDGFRWLSRLAQLGLGACLADDMGLGKTLQALALLTARAKLGPALVVCPTSVGFNWVNEARKFAPALTPLVYRELPRESLSDLKPGQLLIASYGLLVREAERFSKARFATLVLDEAHALKNADTQRAKAVRELTADFRIALTGTPVENHLGELWSLFRLLTPGLLGSWEQFRDRFGGPIERDGDPEALAALTSILQPFLLRRTKTQVAPELPARTEVTVPIELSDAERQLYEAARANAIARLTSAAPAGGEDQRFQVLAELTRLRQLACHPRLVDPTSQVSSAKLERLLLIVAELRAEGHRALIFSQFTSHLALVREAFDAAGLRYFTLEGKTTPAERERRVDAFQKGDSDLFLISLKAGGTGLNLTAADYVIHLDPWWNPAVEDQATDRAHRIGQTRPVTVYRFVAQGTVEEAILKLHEKKRTLVEGLLAGTEGAGKLTTSDLLVLVRGELSPSSGEDGPANGAPPPVPVRRRQSPR